MSIYSIYRATNTINNKVYIGFTSEKMSSRQRSHKSRAKTFSNNKFHNAIRKYGWNKFQWELIYQAKEDAGPKKSHTLTVMEDYFIQEYDSITNGYNSIPGGGLFPILCGENHPLFNIGHSDAAKKKISENHHDVRGPKNPRSRHIRAISPTGEIYDTFGTFKKFCKDHKLPFSSVYQNLRTGRKFDSLAGWIFEYPHQSHK